MIIYSAATVGDIKAAVEARDDVRSCEVRTSAPGVVTVEVRGMYYLDDEDAAERETSLREHIEGIIAAGVTLDLKVTV